MTPTQREPEQRHYRGEISQACRIDLLDSGELNSESLRISLSFSLSLRLLFLHFVNHKTKQQKRRENK